MTRLFVHERRHLDRMRDVTHFGPSDDDLLTLFHGMLAGLAPDRLVDDIHERYISIQHIDPRGRSVLVRLEAGRFGIPGRTRHVRTHAVEHEHDGERAPTFDMRLLLTAPKGAKSALLMSEQVSGSSAATGVLDLFQLAFKHRHHDLMLKVETVVTDPKWLEDAELDRVIGVVAHDWSPDIADKGIPKVVGKLEHVLEPEGRMKHLPRSVWQKLRSRDLAPGVVLGLHGDTEYEEVLVEMSGGGQKRTMVLGEEKFPTLRYPLSEPRARMPTDNHFRNACFKIAEELYPKYGATWSPADEAGKWSKKQLEALMAVPDV